MVVGKGVEEGEGAGIFTSPRPILVKIFDVSVKKGESKSMKDKRLIKHVRVTIRKYKLTKLYLDIYESTNLSNHQNCVTHVIQWYSKVNTSYM